MTDARLQAAISLWHRFGNGDIILDVPKPLR